MGRRRGNYRVSREEVMRSSVVPEEFKAALMYAYESIGSGMYTHVLWFIRRHFYVLGASAETEKALRVELASLDGRLARMRPCDFAEEECLQKQFESARRQLELVERVVRVRG